MYKSKVNKASFAKKIQLFFILALFVSTPGFSQVIKTPKQYFNKMVETVSSINYKGILVFNNVAPGDDSISALEIVHSHQDQKESRVSSIDGGPTSVYRKNDQIKELLGGKRQIEKIMNNPFENFCAKTLDDQQLVQNYIFEFGPDSMVAGRGVKVVVLKPKYKQVFGYSFYIDKEHYMPLKMNYMSHDGANINSYMFVNIEYPKHFNATDLKIKMDGKVVMPDQEEKLADKSLIDDKHVENKEEKYASSWKIEFLPQGFKIFDHQVKKFHKKNSSVEHFVFSDGIALISVYIEALPENQIFRGSSVKGAMSAYGAVQNGHQIVVVGKIPIETLELVGNSVKQKVEK